MAEKEVEASRGPSGSTSDGDHPGDTVSATSPEDESSESPASQCAPDLKSILVTSVLNLEKLDVDLYR